eukprot:SAG25_NODE_2013_length_2028_cov_1.046138_1_plen_22_part_10
MIECFGENTKHSSAAVIPIPSS